MELKPVGYYNEAHGFLYDETDKDCYCPGGCSMEAVYVESQVKQLEHNLSKAESEIEELKRRLEKSNLRMVRMSEENENFVGDNLELTKEIAVLKSQFENQKEIPAFVTVEIERLKNQGIKTLSELYEADIEWLAQGHNYLEGNNLAIAKWFCDNTSKFESVWISWKIEEAEE